MRLGQTYTTRGGNAFVVVDVKPSLITVETLDHSGYGSAPVLRKAGQTLHIRPKVFQALLETGHYTEAE